MDPRKTIERSHYKKLGDKIRKLDKLHSFLESRGLSERLLGGNNMRLALYDEKIVIKFDELQQLTAARHIVKDYYQDWTDSIMNVWGSFGKRVITSWESSKHPLIELWLSCNVDDYPESLKKPGCKLKKITSESYTMVCEVN